MNLQQLIEEVFSKHKPNPPATDEQIVECERRVGYKLPSDLKQFYERCNGARLFGDDYATYWILPLEEIERTRVLIFGRDSDEHAPSSWFAIVDLWDNNYVGIDLATVKNESSLIIDCFHETHGSSDNTVIALSFTEFLQRTLESGEQHYWLGGDFVGYGDALDVRGGDPDIQAFLQHRQSLAQMRHEAQWKALWRAHGWDPDRAE